MLSLAHRTNGTVNITDVLAINPIPKRRRCGGGGGGGGGCR